MRTTEGQKLRKSLRVKPKVAEEIEQVRVETNPLVKEAPFYEHLLELGLREYKRGRGQRATKNR